MADDELLQLHYAVQLDFPDYDYPVIPEKLLEQTLRNKELRDGPLNTAVASMQKGLETLLQDTDKHASKKSVAILSPLPYAEPGRNLIRSVLNKNLTSKFCKFKPLRFSVGCETERFQPGSSSA